VYTLGRFRKEHPEFLDDARDTISGKTGDWTGAKPEETVSASTSP
jgi:hypothetical protein